MTPYKIHLKENRKRRLQKRMTLLKQALKAVTFALSVANSNNVTLDKVKEQGKLLRRYINVLKNRYEELEAM